MDQRKEKNRLLYKACLDDALKKIMPTYEMARQVEALKTLPRHDNLYEVQQFESGLPHFVKKFEHRIYYTNLIDIGGELAEDLESYKNLYEFVKKDKHLRAYYEIDKKAKLTDDAENLFTKVYSHIRVNSFIERYIYLNNEKLEYNEQLFNQLFEKWYTSVNKRPLPLELHVPILFTDFESDDFEIDKNIFIEKIPSNLQLSRNTQTSFTDSSNSIVAGSASHAIVFKNWIIQNDTYDSIRHNLYEFNSFKEIVSIINDFLCALRIVTGIESGTSQILSVPIEWEDSPKLDLPEVFYCSSRNYPNHFDDFGWLKAPKSVNEKDLIQIIQIFKKIRSVEKNNIRLALNRLNTAFLRNKEEDTILDLTIALETLITYDSKSEITYRLASRIAILCGIERFQDYTQLEVFQICKKIYSFRSDVIHGNQQKMSKSRLIKTTRDEEIPTIELSINLLRHVIKVILLNPQFIDVVEIDKLKLKN